MWKTNKRIPKTKKKYMKLYSTLKTNSHFIKFCPFGGSTSCNGNRVWFTGLPLRSLFLNKHYLPSGKWHLSNHRFSLFGTLVQWPNHTQNTVCVLILTFIEETPPVQEMFLLIANIWWTLRPSAQKAIVLKLIVDHSPSNTLQLFFFLTYTKYINSQERNVVWENHESMRRLVLN